MSGEDVAAIEDMRPAPVGNGRPEIAPGSARRSGPTGPFAQELAVTDDRALTSLRARAERAEAAPADLRRGDVRAILGLRRQVEFWQLVADRADRPEAAAVARLAESVDLADRAVAAVTTGSNGFAGTKPIAELADSNTSARLAEQTGIAAFADLAISALVDTAGSADTPNIARTRGKSGKRGAVEGSA